MTDAGSSSGRIADQTAVAAEVLRRKAAAAERTSAAFRAGSEGEKILSRTLYPLTKSGWHELADRRNPQGGNFDELLIGPPGVAVIDAKNWSYPISIKGSDIYVGRYRQTRSLDRVIEQTEIVRDVLHSFPYSVSVRGFLALVGPHDSEHATSVRNVEIVGASTLKSRLACAKGTLSPSQRDDVLSALSGAFPSASPQSLGPVMDEVSRPRVNVHRLFDRNVRFFYIHEWRKGGKRRLYLKNSAASDLGWKNVHTGEITLTSEGDDAALVGAVLRSASPTGVSLAGSELPKVALDIPGGRLFARIFALRALVIVGQEWSVSGSRKLYGTLLDPDLGNLSLGYVDLTNGQLHPRVDGELGKHLGPAVNYLQLLLERRPAAPPTGAIPS